MGKVNKNLSLLRRSTNRTASKPPSTNEEEVEATREEEVEKRINERRAKRDNGGFFWDNLRGKLFYPYSYCDNDWRISFGTIVKILFSIRVASSFWSIISDCDEVYNYWEPLHLLTFGRGFQTWEYSPLYAIRSWFYIYIYHIPAKLLYPLLSSSKVGFFYTLRGVIGLVSLVADITLYESVCQRLGNGVGRLFIIFSIFSVGMFSASCAFLPSSFSMTMNTFAMAAYLSEKWFLAVFFTAISALVGWPFAAVLGLPIFLEMFVVRFRKLAIYFVVYALFSAALILLPMYAVDTLHYGRSVIAPLNIILYNVFSQNGPDLYGVEEVSFYVKNLLLYWNIAVLLAMLSLPISLFLYVKVAYQLDDNDKPVYVKPELTLAYWYRFLPVLFIFLSVFTWIAIFFAQPHKEERFMFPIYPLIALLAAIGLDAAGRLSPRLSPVVIASVVVFLLVSLSRGYALHRNYIGSMETYKQFHDHFMYNQSGYDFSKMNDPVRLCVGKEWHRFSSSFFLPEKILDKRQRKRQVEMRFLKSEFRGLLPKPFAQGPLPNATRQIPSEMNEENREEPSRYVSLDSCDFIIDLATSKETALEPNYAKMAHYKAIVERKFLIAAESHPVYRAFYVPFTDHKLSYGTYSVLQRIRP